MFNEISDAMAGLCSPINQISYMMNIQSEVPTELVIYLKLRGKIKNTNVSSFRRVKKLQFNNFDIYLMLNEDIDEQWSEMTMFEGKKTFVFMFPLSITEDRDINGKVPKMIMDFVMAINYIFISEDGDTIYKYPIYKKGNAINTFDVVLIVSLPILYIDIMVRIFGFPYSKDVVLSYESNIKKFEDQFKGNYKVYSMLSEKSLLHYSELLSDVGIEKLLDYGYIVGDDETIQIYENDDGEYLNINNKEEEDKNGTTDDKK